MFAPLSADTTLIAAVALTGALLFILRYRQLGRARQAAGQELHNRIGHLQVDPVAITFATSPHRQRRVRLERTAVRSDSKLFSRRGSRRAASRDTDAQAEVGASCAQLTRVSQWDRLATFMHDCNASAGALGDIQMRAEEQVDVASYAIGVLLEELAPFMSVDAAHDNRIAELKRSVAKASGAFERATPQAASYRAVAAVA